MKLIERIRQDSLVARKARDTDKGVFLVTLMAEASKVGKDDGNRESTDAEVTAVIKKFIKNTDETLRALGDAAPTQRARLELELTLLNGYLPSQASEAEVRAAIARLVGELTERTPKQMGAIMGKLTAEFAGNFDKGLASKLVKEALS